MSPNELTLFLLACEACCYKHKANESGWSIRDIIYYEIVDKCNFPISEEEIEMAKDRCFWIY